MLIALVLWGCPKPPEPPVDVCSADMSWITNPTQPNEVPETESFCDFYQFSWQWFLAQTSPSVSNPKERVFETNRVYDPDGASNQCSLDLVGKSVFLSEMEPRTIKADKFEHVEADGGALYDQNGNILYYGVYYSKELCSSTQKGFAPGTLEIKTSWMILKEKSNTHYTINLEDGTSLGLVGMHMAIWTPNHPEMIWVSWEHEDNAPLCDGSDPKQDWNFASPEAFKCLRKNKASTPYGIPEKCSKYNFNVPVNSGSGIPLTGTPNNVCQEYAFGNEYKKAVNGNSTSENLKAIVELNEQLVGEKGLLTKLPKDNPMHIWSHYQMVGGLWTKGGAESGKLPVDSKQGPADPNSLQRGSLELTNTTMETFQQGGSSFVPNCFGCHNYKKSSPLTVSHIQQKLLPQPPEK